MNIYKLKQEEIENLDKEFNKTNFGRRAKVFSTIPLGAAVMIFIIGTIFMAADAITDFLDVDKLELVSDGFLILMFGLSAICFSIGCATQLQYWKLLKDYIESKK